MNKKDKEIEYQKGLTELYEETQEMGRGDFVKMIYDLKEEQEELKGKLKKIHRIIHSTYIFGLRHGKTIISEIFQNIDDIIDDVSKLKESDK